MDKQEHIIQLRSEHPDWTLQEIAEVVGCSREYVRQKLKAEGMSTAAHPTRRTGRPRGPERRWKNRFGGSKRLSSHSGGAVSELLVAADLMSKGYHVFRQMAADCCCDLIVCDGPQTYRVEVRSAKVTGTGRWTYNPKPRVNESYDVFAVVTPDGSVRYDPDVFNGEDQNRS